MALCFSAGNLVLTKCGVGRRSETCLGRKLGNRRLVVSMKAAVPGGGGKEVMRTGKGASPGWIRNWLSFILGPPPSLPSTGAALEERVKDLDKMKEKYKWTYEYVGEAPYIEGLPVAELPRLDWIRGFLSILVQIGVNLVVDKDGIEKRLRELEIKCEEDVKNDQTESFLQKANQAVQIAAENTADGVGLSLEEYRGLFDTIPVPDVAESFELDRVFAWYRIAGPNCMMLEKIATPPPMDSFPVTDDMFKALPAFSNDSLAAAASEDRLYMVDYKDFDGLEADQFEGRQKYLYPAKALFAVPKPDSAQAADPLLPVAIQCGQDPKNFPVFTPNSDGIAWIHAKTCVQVADAVSHEVFFHLGRCHLLTEAFVGATRRELHADHPLYRLLDEHLYGTHFINYAAQRFLVNDGGVVDRLTSPLAKVSRDISAAAVHEVNLNNWMPDMAFRERGVDNSTLKSPYVSDALKLWKIINDWVGDYVAVYYPNGDIDVVKDVELQNWATEINTAGKVGGFGDGGAPLLIRSVAYLTRCVSMVIFTASVQHAAVNYTQGTLMRFTPAMPLAGFAPPPSAAQAFKDENKFIEAMMPPLTLANLQLTTLTLIGLYRYKNRLGDYNSKSLDTGFFGNPEVRSALTKFRAQLSDLDATIEERNKTEEEQKLPVYDYLRPTNVPMSINI